jgi:hypothetical protein
MKSRLPTSRAPLHRTRRPVEHGLTRWAFFLLCVFIALSMAVPAAWARPYSSPQRQTVPMTPPPTWTPSRPTTPTEQPTRPQPPTPGPTAPSPTGESTQPRMASPWLGLSAEPFVVQPGMPVSVLLELQNLGDGAMENATITLLSHPYLLFEGVRTSLGQAQLGSAGVSWTPGPLGERGGGTLQVTAVVGPDALPDTSILLSATLSWPGGQVESNELQLSLPAALLPAVGD